MKPFNLTLKIFTKIIILTTIGQGGGYAFVPLNPMDLANGQLGPESIGDYESYDIYFGPNTPKGQENNWVKTVPGKGWNMIFRLYGPLKSWFKKTWQIGDPEWVE